MLRRFYDWMIRASESPFAVWVLGFISFAESSFFPVPPDAMLAPMVFARPERAFRYASFRRDDPLSKANREVEVKSVGGGKPGQL